MKNKIILTIIIIIAALFRFIQLDSLPPSLTWDEVAWGYNAYSIGVDGKDEFGRFLPYDYLESFGDFKPPVYAYLDIVPIKIFGLTEFAVRFPSAFFGVLTVFITYFLVKLIFITSKKKEIYGLITSLLLAISPWHILLSRAAFEANIATFFIVLGMYLFLLSINKKPGLLPLSAISFIASLYTFNTARIVTPLLVMSLAIFFRKKLWKIKKITLASIIFGIIVLIPTLSFLFSPQAKLRYQEVNIFSDISIIETVNREIDNDQGTWWSKILHNRRIFYAREYLKHSFDNLSIDFLFIRGDGNPKLSTRDIGQMYLWELPFFFIGLLLMFRYRENKWFLVPIWLLLAIVPVGAARETPHALRFETALPTFQIIVAYGVVNSYFLLTNFRKVYFASLSLIILFFLTYFVHIYFVHYSWQFSGEWQYGYKESISYVKSVSGKYDNVIVSGSLGRPYAYYLFYLQIPPEEFRKSAIIEKDNFGFVHVYGFSNYHFPDKVEFEANKGKNLYIISAKEDVGGNLEKIFYNKRGEKVLKAISL